MRKVTVRFFIVYELPPEARRRGIADLTRWLEEDRIRHRIAAELPLSNTAEAHELVELGRTIGNVVVVPSEGKG